MAKLALFIKTRTKPGKRAEVKALWDEHLRPRAAANEFQELYFFCEDDNDPDVFHLFEVYKDRESFGANAESPWFAEYMAEVAPLLDGEPEFAMTTPHWAKGFEI